MYFPHEDLYAWSDRSRWLTAALAEADIWIRSRGREAPSIELHPAIALGYSGVRGLWRGSVRAPRTHQVLLNESLVETREVLLVLLHELAHSMEPGEGHGPRFQSCMSEIGVLRCKRRATPDPALSEWLDEIKQKLGPYPVPADRSAYFPRPWDFYERQVCWCVDCGETAYKTPASGSRRDFKSPLSPICAANPGPGTRHRTTLVATLPFATPYPDLSPAERPDFQFERPSAPYILLNDSARNRTPRLSVWGAFHLTYDRRKPWHRLLGLYIERSGAERLAQHVRGLNARSIEVREVTLINALPKPGRAPGALVTVFDVKTNPLLVRRVGS